MVCGFIPLIYWVDNPDLSAMRVFLDKGIWSLPMMVFSLLGNIYLDKV